MNTAKQGLTLFMRSKTMINKSDPSNTQNSSNFIYHLEQGVQTILDSNKTMLGDYTPIVRSTLKRHVQLLVYHRIDGIIKKLVP